MSLFGRLRRRPAAVVTDALAGTATSVARAERHQPRQWRNLPAPPLVTSGPVGIADPRNGAGRAVRWDQPRPALSHAGAGGPTGLVGGLTTVLGDRPLGVLDRLHADASTTDAADLPLVNRPDLTEPAPPSAVTDDPEPVITPRRLTALPVPPDGRTTLATPQAMPELALAAPGPTAVPAEQEATPARPGVPPTPNEAPVIRALVPTDPATPGAPSRTPAADVPVGLGGTSLRLVRRRPATTEPTAAATPAAGTMPWPPALAARPVPEATPEVARQEVSRTPLDPRVLPAVASAPVTPMVTAPPAPTASPAPERPLVGHTPLPTLAGVLGATTRARGPQKPPATTVTHGSSAEPLDVLPDQVRAVPARDAVDQANERTADRPAEPMVHPPAAGRRAPSTPGNAFAAHAATRRGNDAGSAEPRRLTASPVPTDLASSTVREFRPDAIPGDSGTPQRLPDLPLDDTHTDRGLATAAAAADSDRSTPARLLPIAELPVPSPTAGPASFHGPATLTRQPTGSPTAERTGPMPLALRGFVMPIEGPAPARLAPDPIVGPARLAAGLALAEAEVDAAAPAAAPAEPAGEPLPPAEPGAGTASPHGPATASVSAMADELYEEVRSRLRDELLLARERSATLADL